jgi:hypothetical protein
MDSHWVELLSEAILLNEVRVLASHVENLVFWDLG